MAPFTGEDLSEDELRTLCEQAYGRFAQAAVTPLVQLDHRHFLLELFHGPTLAFKDVALQLLGLLFEKFLTGSSEPLTIVGATSGDTGSAAIDAVAGRHGVDIFMLHPRGRVSDVQRRQMTTVLAPNVHNIAIEGSFDDAQAMVKALFNDAAFSGRFRLSAVNSINWARLMAQVVYYFYAAVRLGAPAQNIAFAVPTGNFGDVFAGYVAARMGLPVERLIVATNVNDILHRALSSGDYSAGSVTPTAAPSMDIQVSSNFERLLFDLADTSVAEQMRGFEASRAMRLTDAQQKGAAKLFASDRIDADAMNATMRWASAEAAQVIDPHSAIASPPRDGRTCRPTCRSSRWRRRIRPSSPTPSSAPPACGRRCPRVSAICSTGRSATTCCRARWRPCANTSPNAPNRARSSRRRGFAADDERGLRV